MTEIEIVQDTQLVSILRQSANPRVSLSHSAVEEAFLIACAALTWINWNQPNYTFFLICDSHENPLYIDNFHIPELAGLPPLSVDDLPSIMEVLLRHPKFMSKQWLYEDEEEVDEQVWEVFLTTEKWALEALQKANVRDSLLHGLETYQPDSPPRKRIRDYSMSKIKRLDPKSANSKD